MQHKTKKHSGNISLSRVSFYTLSQEIHVKSKEIKDKDMKRDRRPGTRIATNLRPGTKDDPKNSTGDDREQNSGVSGNRGAGGPEASEVLGYKKIKSGGGLKDTQKQ